jgi:hypothetical protein
MIMENTQGFYKNDGVLLYAPNFVINANYELRTELHETYSLPVDGWYWFDDRKQALDFFGLEEPEQPETDDPFARLLQNTDKQTSF